MWVKLQLLDMWVKLQLLDMWVKLQLLDGLIPYTCTELVNFRRKKAPFRGLHVASTCCTYPILVWLSIVVRVHCNPFLGRLTTVRPYPYSLG